MASTTNNQTLAKPPVKWRINIFILLFFKKRSFLGNCRRLSMFIDLCWCLLTFPHCPGTKQKEIMMRGDKTEKRN